MKDSWLQKTLAIMALIIALFFLLLGNIRSHKVYDESIKEFGILPFHKISERDLVVDATFTGTIRRGDKLFTTYDRSQPVGKRACPT